MWYCSQEEGVLRYWVIAWAVWNGVMFQKNSQPFQIIILLIRSISKPVLQTDAGTKGSATWQLWQPSLPALVLWGAVTVQVCAPGRSEREVMQPAGILQLKLLLCSTGRLTNSAQQHSTPHLSAYPSRAICSQWVILSSDRPGMNHFCSCLQFTADCWGKWWLLRLDY